MPITQANLEINNLAGGLNTEANLLDFPPNSARDLENVIINKDGSFQRRLGISQEAGGGTMFLAPEAASDAIVRTYTFNNIANTDDDAGFIAYSGNLYRIDVGLDAPSTSPPLLLFSDPSKKDFRLTYYNGDIIAVTPGDNVVRRYRIADNILEEYTLLIRDFYGYRYDLETVGEHIYYADSNSDEYKQHYYNLRNSGWTVDSIQRNLDQTGGALPPLSGQPFLGKDPGDFEYYAGNLDNQFLGNQRAPYGSLIIDPFFPTLRRFAEVEIYNGGSNPTAGIKDVASFAGRLFYAFSGGTWNKSDDALVPNLSSSIAFSQVALSEDRIEKCYQEADPTAEYISDLVDTDGGFITITDLGGASRIVPLSNGLLVFSRSGVWVITGGDAGFSANNYSVTKITSFGLLAEDSIVVVGDSAFYWSTDGIYLISREDVTGQYTARPITTNIETFYRDIPTLSKKYSYGVYDSIDRKVVWQYNDTDEFDGVNFRYFYNKELVFDVSNGAFYKNSRAFNSPTNGPYIGPAFSTSGVLVAEEDIQVLVDTDLVVADAYNVIITQELTRIGSPSLKYVMVESSGNVTLADYNNTDFLDYDTTDAAAFVLTGHTTAQDTMRRKQAPYLFVHSQRTETGFTLNVSGGLDPVNESSVKVQSRWDFSDSPTYNKFGEEFEAYRLTRFYMPSGPSDTFDYGREIITTKNKLRGSGKALQLKFSTTPLKNFHVKGWAITLTGSRSV